MKLVTLNNDDLEISVQTAKDLKEQETNLMFFFNMLEAKLNSISRRVSQLKSSGYFVSSNDFRELTENDNLKDYENSFEKYSPEIIEFLANRLSASCKEMSRSLEQHYALTALKSQYLSNLLAYKLRDLEARSRDLPNPDYDDIPFG